jgi:integrase
MKRITDRQLNAKPTKNDIWISETLLWGYGSLVARITTTGERLFYFRYQNSKSKRVFISLGAYNKTGNQVCLTLSEARNKGLELAQIHQSGIKDIVEHLEQKKSNEIARLEAQQQAIIDEQKKLSAKKSVSALYDHWMKIDIVNRKDGGKEVRRIFEKDVLPFIGEVNVEDIRKGDIVIITDNILARGSDRMANVVFSLLRQMFMFAVDRDWIEADPSASIRKSKIGSRGKIRERTLSEEEILELKYKLPKSGLLITSQLAIWIALSSCCRIGEILGASWNQIDFEKKEWLIKDTKNGQELTVFLSEFALSKFKELYQYTGNTNWCFPNRNNDAPVDKRSVSKQVGDRQLEGHKKRITGRSQLTNSLSLSGGKWVPHDLRRTGATMMVANGVSPEVADKCLNHIEENRIKRTYLRYDYQVEMKSAWHSLGEALSKILG